MSELAELERRITVALERIGRGLDRLPAAATAGAAPAAGTPAPSADAAAEIARLTEALEAERIANAQLTERLKAVKERDAQAAHALESRVDAMTRQLDVQGIELQRMRKTAIALREQMRALREAALAGMADAHMINKSMLAELEALRATRITETAELDEILAELGPLVAEEVQDA